MSQFGNIPPTFGEPELVAEQRSWPKVVGIISIVWASLGLVCAGCGVAGLASQSFFLNMAAGQQGGGGQTIPPVPDVMKPTIIDYAGLSLGAILAVVLLVAGIMLLRRSPAARPMHLIYATIGLITVVISTFLQFNKQQALVAWATQNPDNFWAKQQQQGAAFAMVGLALGVVLGGAYPVFTLVWFGLIKKRPEDMGPPPQELVA